MHLKKIIILLFSFLKSIEEESIEDNINSVTPNKQNIVNHDQKDNIDLITPNKQNIVNHDQQISTYSQQELSDKQKRSNKLSKQEYNERKLKKLIKILQEQKNTSNVELTTLEIFYNTNHLIKKENYLPKSLFIDKLKYQPHNLTINQKRNKFNEKTIIKNIDINFQIILISRVKNSELNILTISTQIKTKMTLNLKNIKQKNWINQLEMELKELGLLVNSDKEDLGQLNYEIKYNLLNLAIIKFNSLNKTFN